MALTNPGPFQQKFINFWVYLRTSFCYLYGFLGFCLLWIVLNRTGWLVWDNPDLTYLNLLLSILAEVSAIVILVFTLRINEHNEKADAQERLDISEINRKLDLIFSKAEVIEDHVEDIVEEDNKE